MIYLDNAATTFPKPPTVSAAVRATMDKICANPGRGGHDMAMTCGRLVWSARTLAAGYINAPAPENVVFTFNCTDGLNTAIKGVLRPGMHVITSQLEHNSVLRVLKTMERRGFIRLTVVSPAPDGLMRPADIAAAVNGRTRLVVLTHASNVLGTVQPVEQVGALCRSLGLMFIVDAAQSAGVLPLDVQRMGADMVAMPGHKGLYGPQGTGILYISPRVNPDTLKEGGTGTSSDYLYQPQDMPERFEAGTLNTPGIAGLYAGLRFVNRDAQERLARERYINEYIIKSLDAMPGISVYGTRDMERRVGVVAFNIAGMHSGQAADALNARGIAVRGGLHCAPGTHSFLGTTDTGAVRVSTGAFSTLADASALLNAVEALRALA